MVKKSSTNCRETDVWHNYINNCAVTNFSIPGLKLQQLRDNFHKLSTLYGYSSQNNISSIWHINDLKREKNTTTQTITISPYCTVQKSRMHQKHGAKPQIHSIVPRKLCTRIPQQSCLALEVTQQLLWKTYSQVKGKSSKHESDKLILSSDLPAREAMVRCRENVAQGPCFIILALGCFFHLLEATVLNFIIQMIHASLHHYLSLFAIAGEENQGNICSKTTCLYE